MNLLRRIFGYRQQPNPIVEYEIDDVVIRRYPTKSPALFENVKYGAYTKVGHGVVIEPGNVLGSWTNIGPNTYIGRNVTFGAWTEIGANCYIGDNTVLGSHTRVQSNVIVPRDSKFNNHDLVTPFGVVPNKCGGSVSHADGDGIKIFIHGAEFYVPYGTFPQGSYECDDEDNSDINIAVSYWQWGIPHPEPAFDLLQYRV